MKIRYTHPESLKKINLIINKDIKFIMIYGKNGSGKTTFSLSQDLDKMFVFNTNFIHENVYVVEEGGAKTSSGNKDSFSELLIGEVSVKIKKYLVDLKINSKEVKKTFDNTVSNLSFSLGNAFQLFIRDTIKKIDDPKFHYDTLSGIESINKVYNYPKFKCTIKTDIEFDENMKIYKENSLLGVLLSTIKESSILNDIIINKSKITVNSFNKEIETLSNHKEFKLEFDKFIANKNITTEELDNAWVKKGIKIHLNLEKCILCGGKDIKASIEEWKRMLDSKYVNLKEKLLNKIKAEYTTTKLILAKKEHYIKVAPKTIDLITKFNAILESVEKAIKTDDLSSNLLLPSYELENLTKDISELMEDIVKFKINKVISVIAISKLHLLNIDKMMIKKKTELEENLKSSAANYTTEINEIFRELKLDKKIRIKIDRLGGKIKYKFDIDGKQVNTLSEGQRHKLALALFIKLLKEKGYKDKIVVFDDPIVSLDEESYHSLRDVIISLRISEETSTFIILTHNIYYTYVQMSNIFEREDIKAQTKFYRMTDIQLKELDINILRLDDITLFKKCLSQINSEEELLILGGLTNKIFRYFLDLELRYQGISSTSNPRNEIDLLDIEESKKVELRKVNSFLNGNSKLTRNPSSSVILDCFKELKNALEIFGRKNYILDSDIIRIEKFVTNKKFSFLMESSNILFDFVKAANKILHTEEHKEIKNYLAHPRQQITKQVTSISNDIL